MNDSGGQRWDRGFEGHERAQRRRLAALPLILKLEWLEEAQRLADRLHKERRRAENPSRDETTE